MPSIVDHDDERAKALLNASVASVNVSINHKYWNWDGEPPAERFRGTINRWANKEDRKLYIHWEGNNNCTSEKLEDPGDDSTFLLQSDLDFRLESYADGRPAPKAPAPIANPFLLASSDLGSRDVLIARADTIMAGTESYFNAKVMTDRGAQVERMRVSQIFDPLHAMANPVTAQDVDALKCFRFSKRPDLAAKVEGMKSELNTFNALVKCIKPEQERQVPAKGQAGKDGKTIDGFDMQAWWRSNESKVPTFFRILQAVACHSPNSCLPETVFSILNASFDDEQLLAYADYIELSLQLQFDSRS